MLAKSLKEIPIFFATDDNYAALIAPCLESIIENSSKDYFYNVYILYANLSQQKKDILIKYKSKNMSIKFVNAAKKFDKIGDKLPLRDYYTKTIYFRLMIHALFPKFDKALYIDCDIIVLDDISKLYNHDVSNYYAGVISEDVMANFEVFGNYSKEALGIPVENYFNSGVLVLNLKNIRESALEEKFFHLLNNYKFYVAPDQDYLNVLCKGKVTYIDEYWNKAPIPGVEIDESKLKLIHYKICWKPWHYDNINLGEIFWKYAKSTEFHEELLAIKGGGNNEERRKKDEEAFRNLVKLAEKEIASPTNYARIKSGILDVCLK